MRSTLENTDRQWRKWGSFDPYRAVLFDQRYSRESLPGHLDEFFETGRLQVQLLMRKLMLLYPGLPLDTAVDFGCGVARLTAPLARHFRTVIGVDISLEMLNEARKNCASFGVTNADFVLSDDLLSRVPFGVQLIHSFLVLQHIPVKRGLRIIGRLARHLAPGGVCALHVPVQRNLTLVRQVVYFAKHGLPGCSRLCNLLQGKPIAEPLMQMNPYPVEQVCEALESAGAEDIWLLPISEAQRGVICFGKKKRRH